MLSWLKHNDLKLPSYVSSKRSNEEASSRRHARVNENLPI